MHSGFFSSFFFLFRSFLTARRIKHRSKESISLIHRLILYRSSNTMLTRLQMRASLKKWAERTVNILSHSIKKTNRLHSDKIKCRVSTRGEESRQCEGKRQHHCSYLKTTDKCCETAPSKKCHGDVGKGEKKLEIIQSGSLWATWRRMVCSPQMTKHTRRGV